MAEDGVAAAAAEAEAPYRAILAQVIHFGTRHAAALRITDKTQQELQQQEEGTDTLEKMCLGILKTQSDQFLELKHIFNMMPGPLVELVLRECGPRWNHLPLVDLLVTTLARHAILDFNVPAKEVPIHPEPEPTEEDEHLIALGVPILKTVGRDVEDDEKGWTDESVTQLHTNLLKGAKDLLTLDVRCQTKKDSICKEFSATQLQSLLRETRSLTTFKLSGCKDKREEFDTAIGIVVRSNPGLRFLHTDWLGSSGLSAVADHGHNLLELYINKDPNFREEEAASALNRLPGLQKMDFPVCWNDDRTRGPRKEKVLFRAAEIWDSASPPLSLTDGTISVSSSVAPEKVRQVFTCFPQLDSLLVWYDEGVEVACAGLGGLTTKISKVELVHVTQTRQSQFFALVNEQLTDVKLRYKAYVYVVPASFVVDLGLVAGACPRLENLDICAGSLRLSPDFEPPEEAFTKLNKCSIVLLERDQDHASNAVLHTLISKMLSGPLLETLKFYKFPIPDEVVAALTSAGTEEEAEERVLPSLRSLEFHQQDMSLDTAIWLVSHAPRLRSLVLHYVEGSEQGRRDRQVMTHYMALKLPYVSFSKVHPDWAPFE